MAYDSFPEICVWLHLDWFWPALVCHGSMWSYFKRFFYSLARSRSWDICLFISCILNIIRLPAEDNPGLRLAQLKLGGPSKLNESGPACTEFLDRLLLVIISTRAWFFSRLWQALQRSENKNTFPVFCIPHHSPYNYTSTQNLWKSF